MLATLATTLACLLPVNKNLKSWMMMMVMKCLGTH